MRYQGSKARIAKYILPIVTKNLTVDRWYVEPFMGGCNTLSLVDSKKKIGNDFNEFVVEAWKAFQRGVEPVPSITELEYYAIKEDYLQGSGKYEKWMIGYVGSSCSYGGGWWNGYAKFNPRKNEDHIKEAYNGTMRQIRTFKHLASTTFTFGSYDDMEIPNGSVIYCDPPYASTKKYESDFDNDAFWEWCRKMGRIGNEVYISEYSAPSDFKCVWSKKRKDGMGTYREGEKQSVKIEKLFTI